MEEAKDQIESASERIIWSADVETPEEMIATAKKMEGLTIVKVDRLFTDLHGRKILGELSAEGFRTFYDAKFIEIPSKLEQLAAVAAEHRPWMMNCMAGAVSTGLTHHEDGEKVDGLKRFADTCHKHGVRPCGVTVLTSKTPETVDREFGTGVEEQVLFYAEMLSECEFTDIVCSPKEAFFLLREGTALELNTPGIRFTDGAAGDQARVATPGDAIASGVARVVMGRPLTQGDPAANFARAVTEIDAALAAA